SRLFLVVCLSSCDRSLVPRTEWPWLYRQARTLVHWLVHPLRGGWSESRCPVSVFANTVYSPVSYPPPLRERLKMISQISMLDGTMDGKINVSLKIEDCSFVDDSSLALLAMPDGPFMASEPIKPSFHSFVITVQNGQRIYGGSYIFGL